MKRIFVSTQGFQIKKEVISKLQDKQMLDIFGGRAMVGTGCSKTANCSCTRHTCATVTL